MRIALWCLVGGNAGLLISAMAAGHNTNMALGLLGLTVSIVGLYNTRGAA